MNYRPESGTIAAESSRALVSASCMHMYICIQEVTRSLVVASGKLELVSGLEVGGAGAQGWRLGAGGELELVSGQEVDGTGGAVLVFMGQSEAQHRILREVVCRWVRGEQEQRSRVKHMDRSGWT